MKASLLATGSMDPVGPDGWSGLAWLGFFLYGALFVVALRAISRLTQPGGDREEP